MRLMTTSVYPKTTFPSSIYGYDWGLNRLILCPLVDIIPGKDASYTFNMSSEPCNTPFSKATPPSPSEEQACVHIAPYLHFLPRFV